MITPARSTRLCAGLAALLVTAIPAVAATCTAPTDFPNPQLLAGMARGINIPSWDRPADQRVTPETLFALREAGMSHVRLPLSSEGLQGDRTAYLAAARREVRTLVKLGYTVSVDLHAGELSADPAAGDAISGMWRDIAALVGTFGPDKVAAELLNEPHADRDAWRVLAQRLVREVRAALPEHTIVVGPSGPQRHEELAGMEPFPDRNIVYAVHYYDPFLFTHQGMDWGADDDPLRHLGGLPFPAQLGDRPVSAMLARLKAEGHGEAEAALRRSLSEPWSVEATIAPAFDMIADWAKRADAPVIINEFGVLRWTADEASRTGWLAAVRAAAEQRCFGWTHWDLQDGFGLLDEETRQPDPAALKALLPGR